MCEISEVYKVMMSGSDGLMLGSEGMMLGSKGRGSWESNCVDLEIY